MLVKMARTTLAELRRRHLDRIQQGLPCGANYEDSILWGLDERSSWWMIGIWDNPVPMRPEEYLPLIKFFPPIRYLAKSPCAHVVPDCSPAGAGFCTLCGCSPWVQRVDCRKAIDDMAMLDADIEKAKRDLDIAIAKEIDHDEFLNAFKSNSCSFRETAYALGMSNYGALSYWIYRRHGESMRVAVRNARTERRNT